AYDRRSETAQLASRFVHLRFALGGKRHARTPCLNGVRHRDRAVVYEVYSGRYSRWAHRASASSASNFSQYTISASSVSRTAMPRARLAANIRACETGSVWARIAAQSSALVTWNLGSISGRS